MLGPLIIDTNLLLLLVVGAADVGYIAKHKRLAAQYTAHDFAEVSQLAAAFSDIVLMPNTLTEVSSFARQIAEPARTRIQAAFRQIIKGFGEVYVESRAASRRGEFPGLGLTDAAILHLCASLPGDACPTLLSVDAALIDAAHSLGYDVIDYAALR